MGFDDVAKNMETIASELEKATELDVATVNMAVQALEALSRVWGPAATIDEALPSRLGKILVTLEEKLEAAVVGGDSTQALSLLRLTGKYDLVRKKLVPIEPMPSADDTLEKRTAPKAADVCLQSFEIEVTKTEGLNPV